MRMSAWDCPRDSHFTRGDPHGTRRAAGPVPAVRLPTRGRHVRAGSRSQSADRADRGPPRGHRPTEGVSPTGAQFAVLVLCEGAAPVRALGAQACLGGSLHASLPAGPGRDRRGPCAPGRGLRTGAPAHVRERARADRCSHAQDPPRDPGHACPAFPEARPAHVGDGSSGGVRGSTGHAPRRTNCHERVMQSCPGATFDQ
jgi:hypothetical protein